MTYSDNVKLYVGGQKNITNTHPFTHPGVRLLILFLVGSTVQPASNEPSFTINGKSRIQLMEVRKRTIFQAI